jgi:purine-nucleoside phosphorylase
VTTLAGASAAREAADVVRQKLAIAEPELAIILGSGLGGLVEELGDARSIAYSEIPGFPSTAVSGHSGTLHAGILAGREVLALAGRFHMYEGHSPALAGFPVRVLRALGAPALLVTNAAGGVRRSMRPGDLMIIADQINMMWQNPLVGALEPGDLRFPDMSDPYDPEFREILRGVMVKFGIPVVEGVYLGLSGPAYETPAEVRMLEKLGADAVGMSTIPEVIVARAIGMRVAGISCITNQASGISTATLSHQEVLDVGLRVQQRFRQVVRTFVELIA